MNPVLLDFQKTPKKAQAKKALEHKLKEVDPYQLALEVQMKLAAKNQRFNIDDDNDNATNENSNFYMNDNEFVL